MRPDKSRTRATRARRGIAAMYAVLILTVLCGLVSFGVDVGRVQLAKTELRTAADAAARAAVNGLLLPSQIRSRAVATAAANTCDGTSVALSDPTDIELGIWNSSTRTFTKLSEAEEDDDWSNAAFAVRVIARRTAARGNPISLMFARVVGRNSIDITATAIAVRGSTSTARAGFMSLGNIDIKNNTFFGSYNPLVTTNPTQASAQSAAAVGANGLVDVNNNSTLKGDLILGPSGDLDGSLTITGDTENLSSALTAPTMPSWAPSGNPGNLPQVYAVNSNTTLAGGTYWFTALTVNANLTFSGPATVHVNGNLFIRGFDLRAFQSIPGNLVIYQHGDNRTFGDPNGNNAEVTARVVAPGANLIFNNNLTFRGSGVFKSMETRNNADFFFDQTTPGTFGAGGAAIGTPVISLVQ